MTPAAGTPVFVQFGSFDEPLRAEVRVCHHPELDDEARDVAVLELIDDPPEGVRPAIFVEAEGLSRHPCTMFGFPAGWEDGLVATGELRAIDGAAWLQIKDLDGLVAKGFSGSPVWDERFQGVVGLVVARDEVIYAVPVRALHKAWGELKDFTRPDSPFRGLQAFGPRDSEVFFGRDDEIDYLRDRMDSAGIIVIPGPSGVGKSSLAAAGLLPAAMQRPGTVGAVVRLGAADSLAAAIQTAVCLVDLGAEQPAEEADLRAWLVAAAEIAAGARTAGLAISHITVHGGGRASSTRVERVVLVIDQIDEVLISDPARARTIDRDIGRLTGESSSGPQVVVIVPIRDDFRPLVEEHATAIAKAWRDQGYALRPMDKAHWEQAMRRPLLTVAPVQLAEGLLERIVNDTPEGPAALPLVEYTLSLLWDRQVRSELTNKAYEDIGGVAGALANEADWQLDRLDETEQIAARDLFVQLVRPDDAQHGATTTERPRDLKRVARQHELTPRQWDLARQLASMRLITTTTSDGGHGTVELTHETLIDKWDKLRGWVDQSRSFRVWQERLRADMYRWQNSPERRRSGLLLRGRQLDEALRKLRSDGEHVLPAERAYVTASHRQRQTWRLSIAALVATVLVVSIAIVGYLRAQTAAEQRKALVAELINAAHQNRDNDPALALLLAAQAVELAIDQASTASARHQLLSQLAYNGTYAGSLRSDDSDITAIATLGDAPDAILYTGSAGGHIRRWHVQRSATGTRSNSLRAPHTHIGAVSQIAVNPVITERLITVGQDGQAKLWHTKEDKFDGGSPVGSDIYRSVAFSPDGRVIALGDTQGKVELRDNSTSLVTGEIKVARGAVLALAFGPPGSGLLYAGTDSGELHKIRYAHRAAPKKPAFQGEPVPIDVTAEKLPVPPHRTINSMALIPSPDYYPHASLGIGSASGKLLLGTYEGLQAWDVDHAREPVAFPVGGLSGNVKHVASRGNTAIASSDDRTLTLQAATIAPDRVLANGLNGRTSTLPGSNLTDELLFSPVRGGEIRIWDRDRRPLTQVLRPGVHPWDAALDHDAGLVVVDQNGAVLRFVGDETQQLKPYASSHPQSAEEAAPRILALLGGTEDPMIVVANTFPRPQAPLKVYHRATGAVITPEIAELTNGCAGISVAAVLLAPTRLLLGCNSGLLITLDPASWSTLARGAIPTPVSSITTHGNQIIVGDHPSRDKAGNTTGALWRLDTTLKLQGEPVAAHSGAVTAVLSTRDRIISGGLDGRLRSWTTQLTPQGDGIQIAASIHAVARVPRSQLIAVAADNDMVFADDSSLRPIAEPLPLGQPITHLSVSPDQAAMVATLTEFRFSPNFGSPDDHPAAAIVWKLDPAAWIQEACAIANRNLSATEWQRYGRKSVTPTGTCRSQPEPTPTHTETASVDSTHPDDDVVTAHGPAAARSGSDCRTLLISVNDTCGIIHGGSSEYAWHIQSRQPEVPGEAAAHRFTLYRSASEGWLPLLQTRDGWTGSEILVTRATLQPNDPSIAVLHRAARRGQFATLTMITAGRVESHLTTVHSAEPEQHALRVWTGRYLPSDSDASPSNWVTQVLVRDPSGRWRVDDQQPIAREDLPQR